MKQVDGIVTITDRIKINKKLSGFHQIESIIHIDSYKHKRQANNPVLDGRRM